MDLWLRLQNKKTLIKVDSEISTNGYGRIFVNGDNKIATYKTEERALEVLDEIQKILSPRIFANDSLKPILENIDGYMYLTSKENNISISQCGSYVYEMPLE